MKNYVRKAYVLGYTMQRAARINQHAKSTFTYIREMLAFYDGRIAAARGEKPRYRIKGE